jgi:hypothetical protein
MDINAAMTSATVAMINSIGLSATYTSDSGIPASITVLFDNDYQGIDLASGQIMSSGPAAYCKSSDVPNATQGDEMTINGVLYTVIGIEPDGTGLTILRLKEAE